MGNKQRHAKYLAPIVTANRLDGQPYVEPFVGMAGLFMAIDNPRFGYDVNPYVIALLSAVRDGWVAPMDVSEEQYRQIKLHKDKYAPELVAFVGFGCSFGAKFFGGYARGRDSSYAGESSRNLLRVAPRLQGAEFAVANYLDLAIPDEALVYCDPPYANTTSYGIRFNHREFWQWADGLYERGCTVFVSEYQAPEHWASVWMRTLSSSFDLKAGKRGTEQLFTREPERVRLF